MRLALVFPGQGAQYPRMGADLASDFGVADDERSSLDASFRALSPDFYLSGLMESGSESQLLSTDRSQAVVFAHAAMAWRALEGEAGLLSSSHVIVAALGHSFGELTAHLAAGTLDPLSMSALVLARGRVMRDAPEGGLLNCEAMEREALIELIEAYCRDRPREAHDHLAISQAPRLHAVGGLTNGMAAFAAYLRARGMNCRPVVGVHKPLHTPFQKDIRAPFERVLATMPFRVGRIPVVSTARGDFSVAGSVAEELACQIDSEMRFSQGVAAVEKRQPDLYVALGPASKVAELLAHYNGIDVDRIRVVERSAQVREFAAELAPRQSRLRSRPAADRPGAAGHGLARAALRGLTLSREDYVLLEPSGEIGSLETALNRSGTIIFYKGTFAPIHVGHVALFEASRRRHPGAWGVFAMSVESNKGRSATRDLLFRARLVCASGYPVVIGHSGFFYENVDWLRERAPGLRLVFPTGVDALRRLVAFFSPEEFARRFGGVLFEYADRAGEPPLFPDASRPAAYDGIRQLALAPDVAGVSSSLLRTLRADGDVVHADRLMPAGAANVIRRRPRRAAQALGF
jgi:malonyl CoA-acyl carrier protein transacylase